MPACERRLAHVCGRDQAGEFGEQRGMGEDGRGQEAGGNRAGGQVAVVPEVRGQGTGRPGEE
ncbi:hypothetical protein [Streptomyces shenzhenensis]|uniref:hypothetical protein n=1 Tax=Streptomyces shenzhenensis TaxID=943815 RepID=UPI001F30444F|nr:hypothetical protein [Streptomyces shenzhenensis]